MTTARRVVVAGSGLDRLARRLRDAGDEVVVLGTDDPAVVVSVCVQEDADALAWSAPGRPPGLPDEVEVLELSP